MKNKKAALTPLEETAFQVQFYYNYFLRKLQALRNRPDCPFIVVGLAWLVMLLVCWMMIP